MIKDLAFHPEIRGQLLDDYLARGWYRLGQLVFTTDYIPSFELVMPDIDDRKKMADSIYKDAKQVLAESDLFYRVCWLRFRLDDFIFDKKQKKLLKKNTVFDTVVQPFHNNEEFESLFSLYRDSLSFDISPTLSETLYGNAEDEDVVKNIFDTWVITIREDDRLIAAGIFDKGESSMAGIINIYHPLYEKYSLGKYLMLLKIQLAINMGMKFYYPGYVSPDYDKFDYKLFPGIRFAELFNSVAEVWSGVQSEN